MANKITDGRPAADETRRVTFDEADDLGAYELAEWWADRISWPVPGDEDISDELAELACMSALARWLVRWLPFLSVISPGWSSGHGPAACEIEGDASHRLSCAPSMHSEEMDVRLRADRLPGSPGLR